ncbi:protease inhibitor I42 family protein [Bacillus thuringiensis]|uniref:protease inhibitor I42 family protein n=1 Tax=Bacillus thuringiensis TaxID=1428 RepID=UPI001F549307|nr:protease inhibitor I42 family protein [Bacillus thuringiensis]
MHQNPRTEHIHVPVGQFFSVHLAENPTTGYRWTRIDKNAGMLLLAEHFYSIPITDGPVGKPGIHTFQFKAKTPDIVKL